MRMSLHTGGYTHHYITDLFKLIDYYYDLGYRALDLSLDVSNPEMTEYQMMHTDDWKPIADKIKAKMEEKNMVFCQAHSPIVAYDPAEKDDAALAKCIEISGYLGIPSLVVHLLHIKGCTPESFVSGNVAYYSKFTKYLDKYNVDMCFENIGYWGEPDIFCFSADELLTVINAMNHPHIHACWDTGHGNCTRQRQYNSVTKLGDHLRAVHIHDNHYPLKQPDGVFTPDAHTIPLFGNVNFDSFIQGLIDIGYKGAFSFEADFPNRKGHMDFMYNGEYQNKFFPLPFEFRSRMDVLQADIGKYMMKTYGIWDEE